ncbi:MAG: FAD-dependent oxidoreductase [Chloroflexota bacterium]
MNRKLDQKIVIVGAGILGASVAFHLTQNGVTNITVIDAGEPGAGTSAVSFAWLNAFSKRPFHYHDLNRRSMDMWPRFVQQLGCPEAVTWGGNLLWAATPAGAEELMAQAETLHQWGYPAKMISIAEAQALEPNLQMGEKGMESVTAVCHAYSEGHVETGTVIRACLEQAAAKGATIRTQTRVLGFEQDEGRLTAVHTTQGTLPADVVVLAVGADTPELGAMAGVDIPVYHTFGATLYTAPLPCIFQTVSSVHTAADTEMQVAFRQLPDGRLVFYGGSHGTAADRSLGQTDKEIAQVLTKARQFLPLLNDVEVAEIRRGRRPIPQDGFPIIGFAEAVPNLYLTTMHSGVTLSALVGNYAALEICKNVPIERLQQYRLERFYKK